MATLFALITGFPFELGEIVLALLVSFEPNRELQKVLSFKYINLSCDL
jgi:hypothetical protein